MNSKFLVQHLDTGIETSMRSRSAVVMERCVSETLYTLLMDRRHTNSDLTKSTINSLIWSTSSALQYLNTFSIVHRDIKPDNIMVAWYHDWKFMYFKLADFSVSVQILDKPGHTQAGTTGYFAPEFYGDDEVDSRFDIWSMGVVLAECILGYHPFGRGNKYINACLDRFFDTDKCLKSVKDIDIKNLLQQMLVYDVDMRMTPEKYASHKCSRPPSRYVFDNIEDNILIRVLRYLEPEERIRFKLVKRQWLCCISELESE